MDCISLDKKKQVVDYFLQKKTLIGKDFIEKVNNNFDHKQFYYWLFDKLKENREFCILDQDALSIFNEGSSVNWLDLEKRKALDQKASRQQDAKKQPESKDEKHSSVQEEMDASDEAADRSSTDMCRTGKPCVKVIASYDEEPKKKNISDFVYLFNRRYEALKKILMNRQELQNLTSISRLAGKKDRSTCSIIGAVLEKSMTSNNNFMLTLEDQTGVIKVFVGQNKPELFEIAREIVLDEIIGVSGTSGDNIIFANNITLPDIPVHTEVKKAPDESYALFLSDIHVGSDCFLPEEFNKFLSWINGESGNEKQKELASKVDYIFIAGDLVDGVGIYPNQDTELEIDDIYDQYNECARLLNKIPKRIKIIICPGNHDALRISEPQPVLSREYAKALWDMENVVMVSNPSIINIHSSSGFPGFDILLYHGYSFDYYVANVETIREKGGYDRADLIMKFLLQRRHLAPAYSSTLYVADPNKDHLVLESIPDFFITGHIHKSYVSNYRNITTVCGSCWQSTTSFQEKVGHNPEPARVPLVNLQTRKVKILRFDK
ncbi:DNA-directed DNA polymerase II small subunit [Candidatus Woesearchaeota archaeon]|nr:DNA-directed DNA polymerase II small subunit [Candidatus Woesearchaeota archaeon]